MPRAGLSTLRVIEEAEALADEVGLAHLSLSAIAARLGVQVPSLYKHIAGLDALQQQLGTRARADLADAMRRAAVGKAGADAIASVASAYRNWAGRHPGRYPATLRAPSPEETADVAATEAAVQVIFDVLAGFGLEGADAVHATRALRAALHGFVTLEAAHGFGLPHDVDRSFDRMVAAQNLALAAWRSLR